jgi:hypothetical protein
VTRGTPKAQHRQAAGAVAQATRMTEIGFHSSEPRMQSDWLVDKPFLQFFFGLGKFEP